MAAARMRYRIKGTQLYVSARSEPAYDGASWGRRFSGWHASSLGPNALAIGALDTLRARSRDLVRKDAWINNGVETKVANLVGTGIWPLSQAPELEVTLADGSRAPFRDAVAEAWADWCEEADADGVSDHYGQQSIVARGLQDAGEMLARFRPRRNDDGLTVPLQVQLLEPDLLPVDMTETALNGNRIIAGVEFDAIGRRVAYWLWRSHPGEYDLLPTSGDKVRVPASEICHVFAPLRAGQVRGIPALATVIVTSRELLEYGDAELVRKKFAAMITAFIKTTEEAPEEALNARIDATKDPATGVAVATLEPGTTQVLLPGEDIEFTQSPEVGQSFEPFTRWVLRKVAAGMGVTYEQVTGDLSQLNFSSIRAGLNEFRRRCEAIQHQVLVQQFCRPVYRRFLDEAILAGTLPMPPGYAQNRRRWQRAEWIAPGWRYVNPLDEEKANELALKNLTTSRRRIVAELGYDVAAIDREAAQDKAREETLKIGLSDPRRQKQSPTPASPDQPNDGAAKQDR